MPFIDHKGKFAYATLWRKLQDEPKERRTIHISGQLAVDWPVVIALCEEYGTFVDTHLIEWRGNYGVLSFPSKLNCPVHFNTTNMPQVQEERPIKKPRAGKLRGWKYDWVWKEGEWRKEYDE